MKKRRDEHRGCGRWQGSIEKGYRVGSRYSRAQDRRVSVLKRRKPHPLDTRIYYPTGTPQLFEQDYAIFEGDGIPDGFCPTCGQRAEPGEEYCWECLHGLVCEGRIG